MVTMNPQNRRCRSRQLLTLQSSSHAAGSTASCGLIVAKASRQPARNMCALTRRAALAAIIAATSRLNCWSLNPCTAGKLLMVNMNKIPNNEAGGRHCKNRGHRQTLAAVSNQSR